MTCDRAGSGRLRRRDARARLDRAISSKKRAFGRKRSPSPRPARDKKSSIGLGFGDAGDPTIALPQSKSTASYPAPIDMTIDFDGDFDVSATFDADEGGTMIMRKSGSVSRREIIDEDRGTIRLRRKSRRTSIQRSAVWTIAWAVVLSIVSLAGAGLIGWYGIYLYWRFFC